MDEAIKRLVNDYALCKNAKDLTVQLGPIRRGLNRLQGDSATLADAVEVWMDLEAEEALQPHQEAVRRRRSQALGAPHAAANLLDPRRVNKMFLL